jgi:lipopolysaccharide transport system permease protein
MSNVEIPADGTFQGPVRLPSQSFLESDRHWLTWRAAEVGELWKYRELLFFLAWRDIKVRYKQAALGAAWAVLQPLLNMIVFTVFFGRLVGVPSNGAPYPLFVYSALVLWTYFSGVVGQAGQSLLGNTSLITKVYFPRVFMPVSNAVSGLLDFSIGLGFLFVLMIYYRIQPGWNLILAPVFLLGLMAFTIGASLILSATVVRFRDMKYTVPFLIQLGLFITPVIYPTSLIPKRFQAFAALNPLSGIVEGFRASLFPGTKLDPIVTGVSLTLCVFVLFWGYLYFRRAERFFADII